MTAPWSVPDVEELKELGRGASGRVVLGRHVPTGRLVAVKYLAPELARDPAFLVGFRAEAQLLTGIDDAHIAHLYEYVQHGDQAAMVLELVEGVTLRAMLDDLGKPLLPEAALVLLKGSLLGLAAAHERGVVHRDYKPGNVMVDATGTTRLIDFGIATRAGRDVAVAGTPAYMAPEQWQEGVATPAADVYAATAVFVECLTGRPPFTGDTIESVGLQHRNAPPPVDDVPPPVRGLVAAGLAKRPERRPESARAFVASLDLAATAGYGEGWEERGRRELRRLALLLAALFPLPAVAAAGVGAIALTVLRRGAIGIAAGAAVILGLTHLGSPAASTTPVSAPTVSITDSLLGGAPSSTTAGAPSRTAPRPHRSAGRPTSTVTTPGAPPASTFLPPPVSTALPPPAPPHPPTPTTSTVHTTPPPPPPPSVHLGKASINVTGSSTTADAYLSVFATNTQPFTVRIKFSDGTVDTFTESGATSYTINDSHTFTSCPNPPGTWSFTAVTNPAADNSSVSATPVVC